MSYPQKELEIKILVQVLVRISEKRSALLLAQILPNNLEPGHLGGQISEAEPSIVALSPHAHELPRKKKTEVRFKIEIPDRVDEH